MKLTIQLFDAGRWVDAAIVYVPNPEKGGVNAMATFEYDPLYAFGDLRESVAINYPLRPDVLILNNWPAFLYDLIPQGNGRKYLLGLLGKADGPSADFDLLSAGAFNPIGRIRIKEAVQYYQSHINRHDTSAMNEGMSLAEITTTNHAFVERMLVHGMLAAGTEGISRAARWYHPESRKELGKWTEILATVDFDVDERNQVRTALLQFGQEMGKLASAMPDSGVDADIIEFLKPSIQAQRDQLLSLGDYGPA